MTAETDVKYIMRDPDVLGGKPHIAGHRIAVHHIGWWYGQGMSAEAIAHEFRLTPAEIHAALVYYYDHKDEIDRDIQREAEEHAAREEADTSPIAQHMRALIAARTTNKLSIYDLAGMARSGDEVLSDEQIARWLHERRTKDS